MLTFVQFLEELEKNHQSIVIPKNEVERLVARFGTAVRQIGHWNQTTNGSLNVPVRNIVEAVHELNDDQLSEAVRELRALSEFTEILNTSSAAERLIERLSSLYLDQFKRQVEQFQTSGDPAEVARLREKISQELFGQ